MKRHHIRTPSRLHFGLLGWGPAFTRQFGSVGLMVEDPGLIVVGEPSNRFEAVGPLAGRVAAFLDDAQGIQDDALPPLRPIRIEVVAAPVEHMGLGVGTQLSLAVSSLLLAASGVEEPSLAQLVALSRRGRRSGVGLHGFRHGGLIVDGGRRGKDDAPPLLARHAFPDAWSVLIVRPPGPRGRHGREEQEAFDRLPPFPASVADRVCRVVLLDVLASVAEGDLEGFGAGVEELQRCVGEAFAPVQGGVYATPEAEAIVGDLRAAGLVGAGQSSWGPTLYAFTDADAPERVRLARRLAERHGLDPSAVVWTRASNRGAAATSA